MEIDKRRQDGSCFYCGEKGHRITECPIRPPKHAVVTETKKRATERSTPPCKDTKHDDSLAYYDTEKGSEKMHCDAPPSDNSPSEDEVMSECLEPMVTTVTTIPISRSAGKNTAKPRYGAPGLIKASDGIILSIEKLTKHERYLAEKRFVEANPLELTFKHDSTSTPDQPATMGTIITESEQTISTPHINGKENAMAEELSPNRVRASNGTIVRREDLAIFEKALKDRKMEKKIIPLTLISSLSTGLYTKL
ncbi:---NA--- [Pelobates cultripes]|uniref:---NA n=1 Tax=Pelobates cultripes TaxID=61616 RepID=A0AAD1W144_PELCU|nr:---NA--- [Pelobates cultripes]